MNKRAIYVGIKPTERIGRNGGTLYLGYGMTGKILIAGEGLHLFLDDCGREWYVNAKELYFP